jgi:hypothetical protein
MKEAQGATPEQLKTLFIPLDKQSDEDNFETTNDIAYGITNTFNTKKLRLGTGLC